MGYMSSRRVRVGQSLKQGCHVVEAQSGRFIIIFIAPFAPIIRTLVQEEATTFRTRSFILYFVAWHLIRMTEGAKESTVQAVEEVAVTKNLSKDTVSIYDIYWLGNGFTFILYY